MQKELDAEIDILDDVFFNEQGIPPSRTKRKRDIMEYEEKLGEANFKATEKAFKAQTSQYKVQKVLAENDNVNILLSVMHSLNNLNNSVNRMDTNISGIKSDINNVKSDINTMKSDMNTMKSDITNISRKVDEMTPLMHHVRISENLHRRTFGISQLPLPFLVGEGPSGTDLPRIASVEDIQNLTRSQIFRYLVGYDIEHDRRASSGSLKTLLRLSLGFTLPTELSFLFT